MGTRSRLETKNWIAAAFRRVRDSGQRGAHWNSCAPETRRQEVRGASLRGNLGRRLVCGGRRWRLIAAEAEDLTIDELNGLLRFLDHVAD